MSSSGPAVIVRSASIVEEGEVSDIDCSNDLTVGPFCDQTGSRVLAREQETVISEAVGGKRLSSGNCETCIEVNPSTLRNREKRARRKQNKQDKRLQAIAERVEARIEAQAAIHELVVANKQLDIAKREQAKAHEAGLVRVLDQTDAYSSEVTRLRSELASLEEIHRNSARSSSEQDKAREALISDLKSQLAESTKRQLSQHIEICTLKKVVSSVSPNLSSAGYKGLQKGTSLLRSEIKTWIPDRDQPVPDDHVCSHATQRSSAQNRN